MTSYNKKKYARRTNTSCNNEDFMQLKDSSYTASYSGSNEKNKNPRKSNSTIKSKNERSNSSKQNTKLQTCNQDLIIKKLIKNDINLKIQKNMNNIGYSSLDPKTCVNPFGITKAISKN